MVLRVSNLKFSLILETSEEKKLVNDIMGGKLYDPFLFLIETIPSTLYSPPFCTFCLCKDKNTLASLLCASYLFDSS